LTENYPSFSDRFSSAKRGFSVKRTIHQPHPQLRSQCPLQWTRGRPPEDPPACRWR